LATRAYRALLAWRQRWRDSVLSHPLERHTERTLVDPAALARAADATRARGCDDELHAAALVSCCLPGYDHCLRERAGAHGE
jgi:DNA-binding IclR family transcriptional regulator